jgi:dTDP-glucose 4,6-dehydratase
VTTLLVTGGAGFIGANLVRRVLAARSDWRVVNLDALTYAGNLERLSDVEDEPRYAFEKCDLSDREAVRAVFEKHPAIDAVAHLAAESHVDRSILEPAVFIRSNVLGNPEPASTSRPRTRSKLRGASSHHPDRRGLRLACDRQGLFTETSPLAPNSPAFSREQGVAPTRSRAAPPTPSGLLPVVVTRCSNNYGAVAVPSRS